MSLRWGSWLETATQAIRNVEKSIDKAVGLEEEEAEVVGRQQTGDRTVAEPVLAAPTHNPNQTRATPPKASPSASPQSRAGTRTAAAGGRAAGPKAGGAALKEEASLEELLNSDILLSSPSVAEKKKKPPTATPIISSSPGHRAPPSARNHPSSPSVVKTIRNAPTNQPKSPTQTSPSLPSHLPTVASDNAREANLKIPTEKSQSIQDSSVPLVNGHQQEKEEEKADNLEQADEVQQKQEFQESVQNNHQERQDDSQYANHGTEIMAQATSPEQSSGISVPDSPVLEQSVASDESDNEQLEQNGAADHSNTQNQESFVNCEPVNETPSVVSSEEVLSTQTAVGEIDPLETQIQEEAITQESSSYITENETEQQNEEEAQQEIRLQQESDQPDHQMEETDQNHSDHQLEQSDQHAGEPSGEQFQEQHKHDVQDQADYQDSEPDVAAENVDARNEQERMNQSHVNEEIDLERENEREAKISELEAKLSALSHVLGQRERQLEAISQENGSLLESQQTMIKQLDNKNQALNVLQNQIEDMKVEFSSRLGSAERAMSAVAKERDMLKSKLKDVSYDHEEAREKDEIISALRLEGEKLSKKQLTLEGTIKTLRAAAKENESNITSLKERLASSENLLDARNEKVKELEDLLAKYTEMAGTMKEVSESTSKQVEEKDRALLTLRGRVSELEVALDRAWRDVGEARRATQAAEERREREVAAARADSQAAHAEALRKALADAQQREDSLSLTIQHLRGSLSHANQQAALTEDQLRKEMQSLQTRIAAAEARNEELAAAVPDATRPLLRQIESLQASHAARQNTWLDLERTLTERLREEEELAATAVQNERKATNALNKMRGRVKEYESRIASLESEIERLSAEVGAERARTEEALRARNDANLELERARAQYAALLQHSENKLQAAIKETREQEQARWASREAELLRQKEASTASSGSTSPKEKPPYPLHSPWKGGAVVGPTGSAAATEKLTAARKHKEAELASLYSVLQSVEKAKCNLEDELVSLTAQNESLQKRVSELSSVERRLEDVQHRYQMALELAGERSEQVEELKADLQDMKELYRSQISELLAKIETLSKK